MYTLKIDGIPEYSSEDEQEIVYRIKTAIDQGKSCIEINLTNAFDEDDIYKEDAEDFMKQYDLSDQRAIESILSTTQFYNFNSGVMENAELENGPYDYIFENYHTDKELINNLLARNPEYKLATAIFGENGYLYLSPGYHFVNREGYMIYKTDSGEALVDDYLI